MVIPFVIVPFFTPIIFAGFEKISTTVVPWNKCPWGTLHPSSLRSGYREPFYPPNGGHSSLARFVGAKRKSPSGGIWSFLCYEDLFWV